VPKKYHKILDVGLGYPGLSKAVLLVQLNECIVTDVSLERIEVINMCQTRINDSNFKYCL